MAGKTGLNAKLYRNSANWASPTWVEVPIVGDLAVDPAWDFATAPTRETPVVRGSRTMMNLDVNGKMRVADTDTNYIAFDNAFASSAAVLDLLILNGTNTTNGVTGYRAEFELVKWTEDQGLGNILMKAFDLKPTASANLPKRAVVTAGAPVFTDLT